MEAFYRALRPMELSAVVGYTTGHRRPQFPPQSVPAGERVPQLLPSGSGVQRVAQLGYLSGLCPPPALHAEDRHNTLHSSG